jgi:hypothetical protein
MCDGNEGLFRLLGAGFLAVRARDFDTWYQSERGKGRWPSQTARKQPRGGRPTKQTEGLRNAVLALVHDEEWSGDRPVTKLYRLLTASGRSDVPSPDTLARLVDELFLETGCSTLHRTRRFRRK